MTVLAFIASIVGSLAWPAAFIFLAYLFRREVGPLIASLRKLTWGDKSLEFDRRLNAAEAEASSLALPPQEQEQKQVQLAPPEPAIVETSEVSPELAIIESWLPIERQLFTLGAKHGYGGDRGRSITYLLDRLTRDGVIDRKTRRLVDELRNLRNIALHGQGEISLSSDDVRRYGELAETVVEALRSVS